MILLNFDMDRRMKERAGVFVCIDGLDGIGKGEIERALIEYEQKLGRAVFDSISFSKANRKGLPEINDFWNPPIVYFDTVVSAEPSYTGIGQIIRDEIVSNNGRNYSSDCQIQAYSFDRLVQMQRVVIPALKNGLRVIQSRCLASTLCYQSLKAEEEGKNPEQIRNNIILLHEGNILQLKNRPDLLIIPTIDDVKKVIDRMQARKKARKDDKSIFDNVEFQGRLKPLYESSWLREIFTNAGTKVAYLNAGLTPEDTRMQAIEIYQSFLQTSEVPEKYSKPDFSDRQNP